MKTLKIKKLKILIINSLDLEDLNLLIKPRIPNQFMVLELLSPNTRNYKNQIIKLKLKKLNIVVV